MLAESVIKPLIRAGVKPKLIWAVCRTGRLVMEENKNDLTQQDVDEWNSALKEYQENYPMDDWDMKNLEEIIVEDKF